MNKDLEKALTLQYGYSKAMSAIYSNNVKKIFDEPCFEGKWFLRILENIIIANKDMHVLNAEAKQNIYEMLFELRFNNNLLDPDLYNELVVALNSTGSEFEIKFLCDLTRKRSFYKIKEPDPLIDYDLNAPLELYEYDANLIEFLMCPRDDFEEYGEELVLDEFYIYSIDYLINTMPEILEDKEILYRISKVINTNKRYLKYKPLYILFKSENSIIENKIKEMTKDK